MSSKGFTSFWIKIKCILKRMYLFVLRQTVKTQYLGTSMSDNMKYPDFCFLASIDSKLFKTFRLNYIYIQVLEHTSKKLGLEYLEYIKASSPDLLEKIETFKRNDWYGSPITYEYPCCGKISPSTLRYIKVLSDLINLFGNLDNYNICEIGIGYGGQCNIICSHFNIKSYTLIDLPQVLALSRRYLNGYNISAKLIFQTMNELDPETKYDLFISNYAFSELPFDIQECYYNKTIINSKNGYIIYNAIRENTYTLDDYNTRIPGLRIVPEVPLSHIHNHLLFWHPEENSRNN